MPRQRTIDVRISEKEEELKRLKTLKKIRELQDELPQIRRRKRQL